VKVTGIQKQNAEVDISIDEIMKSLKNYLYNKYRLPATSYLENGVWMEEIWGHTSHAFRIDEKVRTATQEELEVNEAFNTIQRIIRKSI
tara:strand:- start:624 stop:890 length:267 start_codon:yes stop_codon:yes gene_type:complete